MLLSSIADLLHRCPCSSQLHKISSKRVTTLLLHFGHKFGPSGVYWSRSKSIVRKQYIQERKATCNKRAGPGTKTGKARKTLVSDTLIGRPFFLSNYYFISRFSFPVMELQSINCINKQCESYF